MPDISDAISLADTSQDDAARNIADANLISIPPDVMKEDRDSFEPNIKAARMPAEVPPVVAQTVSQSSQHASLYNNPDDIKQASYFERFVDHASKEIFDIPNLNRQSNEMALKAMNDPNGFSEDDFVKWGSLQDDIQATQDTDQKVNQITGAYESLPAKVIAGAGDMVRAINDNRKLVASFTGAGIASGALTGSPLGPVISGAGGLAGGTAGFFLGVDAASTWDTYKQTAGSMYSELTFGKDDKGQPYNLDQKTKTDLAQGLGVISGGVGALTHLGITALTPQLSKFFTPSVRTIVMDAANTPLKNAAISIGKSMGIAAAGGGAQEFAKIVYDELANSYVPSDDPKANETNLLNALTAVAANAGKNAAKVAGAAVVGAGTGGLFALGANVFGANELSRQHEEYNQRFNQATDVTPQPVGPDSQIGSMESGSMPINNGGGPTEPQVPPSLQPNSDLIHDGRNLGLDQKAIKAVQTSNLLLTSSAVTKTTNVHELAPEQMAQLRQDVLEQHGVDGVYVNPEDLNKLAKDDPTATKIRNMIDPSGIAAAQMNAPIKVKGHDFLNLIDDLPEAANIAKLNPEDPSANTAKAYMEARVESAKKRIALMKSMSTDGGMTEEGNQALEKVGQKEFGPNDIMGEDDYLNQPTFTKAIAEALPDKQVEKYNEAQRAARQSVVDSINDAAQNEMDKVKDVHVEMSREVQAEIERQKLENDPNLDIVDAFTKGDPLYETALRRRPKDREALKNELTENHYKPGFSPMAIDPRTLPPELEDYAKNAQLKKHKVFVKGGITSDEAARMVGVPNGKQLLSILSRTPSREDIIAANVAKREKEYQDLADRSVDLNQTAIAKAYNNNTLVHLRELKFMKDQEWPQMRGGIKRIALPLPSLPELNNQARAGINQTIVRDLNANQFKVGERRSQRMAINAILKNDIPAAFQAKEAAALNSEFAKEAHIAIGQVNRTIRFARQFSRPEVMRELRDAGGSYWEAAKEILDVYSLNPNFKSSGERTDAAGNTKRNSIGQTQLGAFNKWAQEMVEKGEGDFQVPAGYFVTKTNIKDMSVEEVRVIGDRLQSLLYTARRKNQLLMARKKSDLIETLDGYAAALKEVAVANPDYDPRKLVTPQGDLSAMQRLGQWLSAGEAFLSNMEHQLHRADNYKTGGLYNELIFQRMAGIGEFKGTSLDGLNIDIAKIKKNLVDFEHDYGKKEWFALGTTPVNVPELSDNQFLNKGKLTKVDLMMMSMNLGTEDNRAALEKFGITRQQAFDIVEKNLSAKEIDFTQRIWDIYEILWSRVVELHERTEGITPEKVPAVPFTMHGVERRGGYFPIFHQPKSQGGLDEFIGELTGDVKDALSKKAELGNNFYSSGMTRQGHLITRQGSNMPLSLSMGNITRGFGQVLSDLNMREPVRDTLNILKHPEVIHDLSSIIGKDAYSMIVNTVIDAANSRSIIESALYQDNASLYQRGLSAVNRAQSNMLLVGNMSSMLIQANSIFFAWEQLGGINGGKHLANTMRKIALNIHNYGAFYKMAAEINPSIRQFLENIEDQSANAITEVLPVKGYTGYGKGVITPVKFAQQWINHQGMQMLGQVDNLLKTTVTLAGYSQFMAGEAPGWTKDEIMAMSPEERHNKAVGYASSAARMTLTTGTVLDRAPAQKIPGFKPYVRFWNDLRNEFNQMNKGYRKTKNAVKSGEYGKALGFVMMAMTMRSLGQMYQSWTRNNDWDRPLKNDDLTTMEGLKQGAIDMAYYFAQGPSNTLDSYEEAIPLVRDVKYATMKKTRSDTKTVTFPLTSMLSDFATAGAALPVAADNIAESLGIIDSSTKPLSKAQITALMRSGSFLTGAGVPVNAVMKLDKYFSDDESTGSKAVNYLEDQIKKLKDNTNVSQSFRDDLDKLQAQFGTKVPAKVPEETAMVIAQIESAGKWNAKNPNSTAAGLYQFTEGTWKDLMMQAPQLGLTQAGRTAKDTSQQELAMNYQLQKSASRIQSLSLPVNSENLYVMHFLGNTAGPRILNADDNYKIKDVVGKNVMTANDFPASMTVKGFKAWVSKKVQGAEDDLLTPTAAK